MKYAAGRAGWYSRIGFTVVLVALLAACSGSASDTTEPSEGSASTTTSEPMAASSTTSETTSPSSTQAQNPDLQPLPEMVSMNLAYAPSIAFGVAAVAQGMGFFEEENLDVEFVPLSSTEAMVLVAQGELDATMASMSSTFLNGVNSGLEIRGIAGVSKIDAPPGFEDEPPPSGVYTTKELFESGELDSYEELEGRTIAAVGGLGASASFLVGLYLEAGGLSLSDAGEIVNLSTADSLNALENGAVDAAFLTAPFSIDGLLRGVTVDVGSARDIYGSNVNAGVVVGPRLLVENRQAGVAFMRALFKAAEAMEGDYRTNDAVVQAIADTYDLDPDAVRAAPIYTVVSDLKFDEETPQAMQETFLEYGGLLDYDTPIAYEELVDDTLRQDALASLPGS